MPWLRLRDDCDGPARMPDEIARHRTDSFGRSPDDDGVGVNVFGDGEELRGRVAVSNDDATRGQPIVLVGPSRPFTKVGLGVAPPLCERFGRFREPVRVRDSGTDPHAHETGTLTASKGNCMRSGMPGRLGTFAIELPDIDPDHDDARSSGASFDDRIEIFRHATVWCRIPRDALLVLPAQLVLIFVADGGARHAHVQVQADEADGETDGGADDRERKIVCAALGRDDDDRGGDQRRDRIETGAENDGDLAHEDVPQSTTAGARHRFQHDGLHCADVITERLARTRDAEQGKPRRIEDEEVAVAA